jgi:hypothetical protein
MSITLPEPVTTPVHESRLPHGWERVRVKDVGDVLIAPLAEQHRRKAPWSPENPGGRWRAYSYDELIARDKVSLDIFWLRDESLDDSAKLPEPDLLAAEIVQDLQAALEQFAAIAEDLADPIDSAVLLFQGNAPAVVEQFVAAEPYVRNGLVTSWRMRPWTTVVGDVATAAARPATAGATGGPS